MARVADAGRPLATVDKPADSRRMVAIAPSDTVDLTLPCSRIYIGVSGHVTYLDKDGTSRLIKNCAQGSVIHGDFHRIMSTDTTATDIMAVY